MTSILDCVLSFEKLINYEYKFILGRKGKKQEIKLGFEKIHCFHLLGLQYLKDLRSVKLDREEVFNKIKSGYFSQDFFEDSTFYYKIRDRVAFFPYLEHILDSNKTIFKYNPKNNGLSLVEADFLLKNEILSRNVFVFLCENLNQEGRYFCRSFFPQDKIDYSKNQTSWTLLYKAKKNIETGEVQVLFENPSYKREIVSETDKF